MININEALIYIGSAIIILWGIAHLIPTKNVVNGFGSISEDNKKIITMESISEGLTLIFLGVLPALITILAKPQDIKIILASLMVGAHSTPSTIVYLACAVMLLVMALLTLFTGARISIVWYKICPAVKTAVAILFILGVIW